MFFNLQVVENNQIIKLPEKTRPALNFLSNQGRLPGVIVAGVGHWSVDTTAGADNNF